MASQPPRHVTPECHNDDADGDPDHCVIHLVAETAHENQLSTMGSANRNRGEGDH